MSPDPPIMCAKSAYVPPTHFPGEAPKPHWVGLWLFRRDPSQEPTDGINSLLNNNGKKKRMKKDREKKGLDTELEILKLLKDNKR